MDARIETDTEWHGNIDPEPDDFPFSGKQRNELDRRLRACHAEVHLESGEIVRAEIHRYEATGIGKREFKIKRIL